MGIMSICKRCGSDWCTGDCVEREALEPPKSGERKPWEERLDALMTSAFDTNHPAMKDYAMLRLELKLLRRFQHNIALCPDHRDKHELGERCIVCRAEELGKLNERKRLKEEGWTKNRI